MSRMSHVLVAVVIATAGCVGIAACGDEDKSSSEEGKTGG
jgi:hypothetical protein